MDLEQEFPVFERAFKSYNFTFKDSKALAACVQLAKEYKISAQKIAFDYELLNSTRWVAPLQNKTQASDS